MTIDELSKRMDGRSDVAAELIHEVANRLETWLDRIEVRLDLQA